MNWLRKLLGLDGHDKINEVKQEIRVGRDTTLKDLKKLNKRFRLTIESGTIEVVIKDINEIAEGK